MKLIAVWIWESLENIPLLLSFVVAVRMWEGNRPAALAILIAGMGLGVLVTRAVEPKLHKGNPVVHWTSTLWNFLLFVVLSIPFLYYFRANSAWVNWKTDLLAGLVVGMLLSYIQSLHWTGRKSRILLHGAAMTVSIPMIMLGLRSVLRVEDWGLFLLLALFLALFASLVIALIDYQEMYRKAA